MNDGKHENEAESLPVKTPGREPGEYYYDDVTGYEVYDPEKEDEDNEAGQQDQSKEAG